MATEKTKQVDKKVETPVFSKEQFLSSPKYTTGQRAFIGVIEDKLFPMSVDGLNKRLGVN